MTILEAFPEILGFFGREDIHQIGLLGKAPAQVIDEIRALREGTPPVRLARVCVRGDGITRLKPAEEARLAEFFHRRIQGRIVTKFVTASGAASRMFRSLRLFLARQPPVDTSSKSDDEVGTFLNHLSEYAFYDQLQTALALRGCSVERLRESGGTREIIKYLLSPDGLNCENLPKGLLPYHRYPEGSRSAMEEHLLEAAGYAKGWDGVVRVHFTVSPEHIEKVRQHLADAQKRFKRRGVRYHATFSVQQEGTNTIAVDGRNNPVRDEDGKLIFRPSGHGALLKNLNDLQGDIVFIKTVDNVLPDRLQGVVCFYKKVLGGYLISIEERIHNYLRVLSSGYKIESVRQIQAFAKSALSIRLPPEFDDLTVQEKAETLYLRLNRPLRVCGVVPHTGDPGGAPFWVETCGRTESLRIVEEAEVDHNSEEQTRIWRSSGYFNPVDIVCSLRDFKRQPFNLEDYQDPDASFAVFRWHGNRRIKILERPGLWNGAMARWNTVFVEVPRITVHPVKSILDLLSWQHRT